MVGERWESFLNEPLDTSQRSSKEEMLNAGSNMRYCALLNLQIRAIMHWRMLGVINQPRPGRLTD